MIRQPGADEQFREAAMHIAAFLLSGACPAQLALREVRYAPYARAGGASALEHSADRAGALARFSPDQGAWRDCRSGGPAMPLLFVQAGVVADRLERLVLVAGSSEPSPSQLLSRVLKKGCREARFPSPLMLGRAGS